MADLGRKSEAGERETPVTPGPVPNKPGGTDEDHGSGNGRGSLGRVVVAWFTGMPGGLAAVLYVVLQLVAVSPALGSYTRDVLVEREQTRRYELAWRNTPAVQRAGGDAAAVAQGLQGTAAPTAAANTDAPGAGGGSGLTSRGQEQSLVRLGRLPHHPGRAGRPPDLLGCPSQVPPMPVRLDSAPPQPWT